MFILIFLMVINCNAIRPVTCDNITIVVTCFGPGIHVLAKNPTRPVTRKNKQRVKSLADYGVKFHACGNTLKALGWTKDDLHPFVERREPLLSDVCFLYSLCHFKIT